MGAVLRLLHDPRRLDDRLRRHARHHGLPRRRHQCRHLGHLGVSARICGASADHRPTGRQVRTETRLPGRPRRLHSEFTVVRADHQRRGAHRRTRHPRHGSRLDDTADHGRDHSDLPTRSTGSGDGNVGRRRRNRDAGRPHPRRGARRRLRLGMDLLHQRPSRHHRPGNGDLVGAQPRDSPAPVRLVRRRALGSRHVPAGLRNPTGTRRRVGTAHRTGHRAVRHRRWPRRPQRLRPVAEDQHL